MLVWKSPATSILTEKEQTSQCGVHTGIPALGR